MSVITDGIIALCFVLFFLVMKSNSYAASTIQVEEGQPVVSTGPYAYVRHPMYSGALLFIAAIPLALGSWWGVLLVVPPFFPVLVWRILDEENFLQKIWQGMPSICSGYDIVLFLGSGRRRWGGCDVPKAGNLSRLMMAAFRWADAARHPAVREKEWSSVDERSHFFFLFLGAVFDPVADAQILAGDAVLIAVQ